MTDTGSIALLAELAEHTNLDRVLEVDERGHLTRYSPGAYASTLTALDLAYRLAYPDMFLSDMQEKGLPVRRHLLKPSYDHECTYCGADRYECDGQKAYALLDCPYPNGYTVTIDLPVPSGRMIVGNDFRPQFDLSPELDEAHSHYINANYGIRNTVRSMAEQGAAHFFVGNSCPGFWRQGDVFLVANPGIDENYDRLSFDGEQLGTIGTDLWWVTIVDGDDFDRRGVDKELIDVEVAVKPGIYQFQYNRLRKNFPDYDSREHAVYAFGRRKHD